MGRGIFAEGYFRDVSWWPWSTIPQGAFLNATIKSIRGPVTLPQHLLKYTYRFPALSRINGMMKSKAWKMRGEKEFVEQEAVLKRQQAAMDKYIASVNVLQSVQRIAYKMEKQFVESLLTRHVELEENENGRLIE